MNEADILEQTYFHSAKVVRSVEVRSGAFDDFKDQVIYENLSCALSFTKGSQQGLTDTYQPIEYVAILFARPEIIIEAGDKVTVTVETGRVYELLAGESVDYPSHIEVPMIRSDRA